MARLTINECVKRLEKLAETTTKDPKILEDPNENNSKIFKDPKILDPLPLAQTWGVYEGLIRKAVNKAGRDYVEKEITFVANNPKALNKKAYAIHLLKNICA